MEFRRGVWYEISVLGFAEKPIWRRSREGLLIETDTVKSDLPVIFKIVID